MSASRLSVLGSARRQAVGGLPAYASPQQPSQAGKCILGVRGDEALSKGVIVRQSSDLGILELPCGGKPGKQCLMVFRADGKRATGCDIANDGCELLYALDLLAQFVLDFVGRDLRRGSIAKSGHHRAQRSCPHRACREHSGSHSTLTVVAEGGRLGAHYVLQPLQIVMRDFAEGGAARAKLVLGMLQSRRAGRRTRRRAARRRHALPRSS